MTEKSGLWKVAAEGGVTSAERDRIACREGLGCYRLARTLVHGILANFTSLKPVLASKL